MTADQQAVPEGSKILPCEICRRPIVTKSTNKWAAHWDCVVYGKGQSPDSPDSSDTRT